MNSESTPERDGVPVACSVLIPVLNEERHIEASINAMRSQRLDGELEFLVVDGESTDRTREIVDRLARQDPRIRLLANPSGATPSGLNIALRHARGRWVARMDAHSDYPADYLKLGIERLSQGGTRWVSGPMLVRGYAPVSRAVALALGGWLGRGGSRRWATGQDPDAEYELDSGVFLGVWERDTLLEYGGWDEAWMRNQDAEMAGRFLGRGERLILVPAMQAAYAPRNSLPSLARQYFGYGEYRIKTALRHPHTLRRSHLLAPGVVAALAASIGAPRTLRRPARAAIGVYASALVIAGARAVKDAQHPADAALVPAVLAAMHLGNGAGALVGTARNGPPVAALAQILGWGRLAQRLASAPSPVFAPSLRGGSTDAETNRGT